MYTATELHILYIDSNVTSMWFDLMKLFIGFTKFFIFRQTDRIFILRGINGSRNIASMIRIIRFWSIFFIYVLIWPRWIWRNHNCWIMNFRKGASCKILQLNVTETMKIEIFRIQLKHLLFRHLMQSNFNFLTSF